MINYTDYFYYQKAKDSIKEVCLKEHIIYISFC